MRERVDKTGMNSEIRIEVVREFYPVRFRDQTQQGAVAVERPVSATCVNAQTIFVVPVERGFRNPTIRLAIDKIDRLVANPID